MLSKLSILVALVVVAFTNIDSSHADFAGAVDLACEQRVSMPEHYSATIKGPSARGVYTLTLTESFYGYVSEKKFRLRLASQEKLESSKASVEIVTSGQDGLDVKITTESNSGIPLLCK